MSQVPNIDSLLSGMGQHQASDLHLKPGMPPYYRLGGRLRRIDVPALSSEQIEAMVGQIMPAQRAHEFRERGSLDFSYQDAQADRYRVNVFHAGGVVNAAIRRVRSQIPSFEDLNLPPIYGTLLERTREGLILVSGVTGSGKSTTLAAMVEYVNENRAVHIVTIEDPVEYVFKPQKAIVSQREIGIDVPDYAEALKHVVRQDPDVIFIGELRDQVTMAAALQASETGHLVFGATHCADAPQTFTRILEFFPKTQHDFIRSSLANSLQAICSQRLIPCEDEKIERVPATEVLLTNPTVRDKIRTGQDEDLVEIVAHSPEEGMRNFTQSLAELVEGEWVDRATAMSFAPNPEALAGALSGIKKSAAGLVHRIRRGGT
jgi:twitching motility protein PilT